MAAGTFAYVRRKDLVGEDETSPLTERLTLKHSGDPKPDRTDWQPVKQLSESVTSAAKPIRVNKIRFQP